MGPKMSLFNRTNGRRAHSSGLQIEFSATLLNKPGPQLLDIIEQRRLPLIGRLPPHCKSAQD